MIKALKLFLIPILLNIQLGAAAEKIPLWTIEHQHGHVYLLGSFHLLKEPVTPFREEIEAAFSESRCLVVEAHIGSENMLENAGKMLQAGMLPEGEELSGILSTEKYRELELVTKEIGVNLDLYRTYRPWMLALTISSLSMIQQGYNPMLGVDLHFINRAEAAGMEIQELEGVDYQIALFQKMSSAEEEAFLFSTIMEEKSQNKSVEQLVSAWKNGDMDALSAILEGKENETPELKGFYNSLLHSRNQEMAEKIGRLIRNGKRCLVVVGAAHLIGRSGIVNLLRQDGFTVSMQ